MIYHYDEDCDGGKSYFNGIGGLTLPQILDVSLIGASLYHTANLYGVIGCFMQVDASTYNRLAVSGCFMIPLSLLHISEIGYWEILSGDGNDGGNMVYDLWILTSTVLFSMATMRHFRGWTDPGMADPCSCGKAKDSGPR